MNLSPFMVISPEYGIVIPIVDGQGPTKYCRDVVFIEAETRRDALLLGVALLKARSARYLDKCDGRGPYAGVEVIAQRCPAHGLAVWNRDHYECPSCEALW